MVADIAGAAPKDHGLATEEAADKRSATGDPGQLNRGLGENN